jgi:glucokinase
MFHCSTVPSVSRCVFVLTVTGPEKPEALVAGVDIGGSHFSLALADGSGRFLARASSLIQGDEGPETILSMVAQAIEERLGEQHASREDLKAIGLAVPGVVDPETGVVGVASNLTGWIDVPVAEMLRRRFPVPVLVENDVNLAALGEMWQGAGRGRRHLLFVAPGTGIGAGVIIDGRLHRGAHHFAGEMGYGCPGAEYLAEDYGLLGCLEALASGPGLLKRARERLGTRLPADATARDVFEMARAGDADAAALCEEAATLIGIAVGNAVTVLDPEIVVFGGGLSREGEALLGRVREVVYRMVPVRPEIVVSALGDDAQLYGAVRVALEAAGGTMGEDP